MPSEPRSLPSPLAIVTAHCRAHFVGAIGFSALINLLYLAPTIYMMQVYDRAVPTGSLSTLFFLTIIVMTALAALAALDGARSRLLAQAGLRLDRRLSATLVQRGLEAGAAATVSLRGFDQVRQFLSGAAMLALLDLPWTPIYVAAAFLIHPALGLFILGGGALLFLIGLIHDRAAHGRREGHKTQVQAYAEADDFAGIAEASRAMGMTASLGARHLETRAAVRQQALVSQNRAANCAMLIKFVRLALQSGALGFGAWLAIAQQISAGAIIAASILLSRALQPVEQMVGSWQGIRQAWASWRNLASQLDPGELQEPMPLPDPVGRLLVEQVSYRPAPGGPVLLRQLSFHVDPGELLIVTGPSGAGKSTLARLLAGAIDPVLGTVRLDGANLADWPADHVGRHIGYLPQQPALVAGSVRDNISRFALWRGEDRHDVAAGVVEAAMLAGLHTAILDLPAGYDTLLGPGGSGVSAGQAQRIALARALYGAPVLIVLDEPNSAQDLVGEQALIDLLVRLRERGAATIVVAHRGPMLGLADRLMLLRAGRIESIGAPTDLLGAAGSAPRTVRGGDAGKPVSFTKKGAA